MRRGYGLVDLGSEKAKAPMAGRNMRLFGFCVILTAILITVSQSNARCFCQCVAGRVIALCDTSSDIRPACVPTLCPPNLNDKRIPLKCEQRQLCDVQGRCRLRKVCE